jgi:hypothetical protein
VIIAGLADVDRLQPINIRQIQLHVTCWPSIYGELYAVSELFNVTYSWLYFVTVTVLFINVTTLGLTFLNVTMVMVALFSPCCCWQVKVGLPVAAINSRVVNDTSCKYCQH